MADSWRAVLGLAPAPALALTGRASARAADPVAFAPSSVGPGA
jgi:hypothetical protein